MRSSPSSLARIALLSAIASSLLPACGGGGGGGGGSRPTVLEIEPNDELASATNLILDQPVKGDVVEPEDEDWFELRLSKDLLYQVELYGTRLDQAAWEATGTVPRLTIVFPNDEEKLFEHGFGAGWTFAAQDFDIPVFRAPQNGIYWFVVRADTDLSAGASYVLKVSYANPVSGQKELEEPLETGVDDTPGTAQTISTGTWAGFHREGNDDFYKIQVSGPRVLRAELVAQRNGAFGGTVDEPTTYYDPLLRLFDVDGSTVLAENDDAYFADPGIQHHVDAAGTYFLQVTQNPASAEDAPYVLRFSSDPGTGTAETEPNDSSSSADSIAYGQAVSGSIAPSQADWFRFQGDPGDMIRLQVFDVANSMAATEAITVGILEPDGVTLIPFDVGPQFQVMTTILQSNGPFFILVLPGPTSITGTAYRLELTRFHSATPESEPNDALAAADLFPGGKFAAGAISVPGDRDLFHFTSSVDQLVTFAIYAGKTVNGNDGFSEYSGHGSTLDPVLTIRDTVGAVVATSTGAPAAATFTESVKDGLPVASVTFVVPPTSQSFFLEVTAADGSGTDTHTYVVERR